MHWWQGAFSSSSRSNSDDEGDVGRHSHKSSFFFSRRARHVLRAKKAAAAAAENDVWRKESSSSVGPQPLPLPELQVLLRKDQKFSPPCSVPLPSPRDKVEDWVNADAAGDALKCSSRRSLAQETKGNAEQPETRSSRKSPHKRSAKTKSSENISIASSAPTSPYSTITLSPPIDIFSAPYRTPPGLFQVWSAPEIPHSDRNLGLGFHSQWPSDRSATSVDNSPLHSPRLSTHIRSTSPSVPNSPLSTKIPPDSPLVRWESIQANVHPLPLPPGPQPVPISPLPDHYQGASSATHSSPGSLHSARHEFVGANAASQSAPISPVASKPERTPIKSKWQKGKLIGRGTFGSVYVASNRETGALCAMKEVEILPDDSKSAECMRQLQQEIKVLSRLKHPNIVRYYGSEIVGDKFHIYLEYVHPGSINKFIQDHCGAITESVVRNFTRHILSGLAYLHKKKTIHRDIKGANLLVDAYGVVKLADFGMAKHLTGQAAELSLKGSPYWLAPELLQSAMQKDSSSDVALAVDIWSLGCTIIEMMNGRPPWSEYEGAAAMFKVLQENPPIPETLSADGKDFLLKCFRRNPAERPSASMLLEHPFLNYSQQCDAATESLNEMKLSENTHFLRECPIYRKGKPGESHTIQQQNQQIASRLAIPSPRSTLDEALPPLSTHGSGHHNPDTHIITGKSKKGSDIRRHCSRTRIATLFFPMVALL